MVGCDRFVEEMPNRKPKAGHPLWRCILLLVMVVLGGSALKGGAVQAANLGPTLETVEIQTAGGVRRFTVEVMANEIDRQRGLMFRTSLPDNQGMLFDFEVPRIVAMWMKNTLIPLDMLFIDKEGQIVRIEENAAPQTLTPRPSGKPVLAVLELGGGVAAKHGIRPGDRVRHRLFPPVRDDGSPEKR